MKLYQGIGLFVNDGSVEWRVQEKYKWRQYAHLKVVIDLLWFVTTWLKISAITDFRGQKTLKKYTFRNISTSYEKYKNDQVVFRKYFPKFLQNLNGSRNRFFHEYYMTLFQIALLLFIIPHSIKQELTVFFGEHIFLL